MNTNQTTGLFLLDEKAVITSIDPMEGQEGTIVTIKGSGFSPHVRNNCIVVGGMGACARTQPGSTATELKVRIDPVAKISEGDVLMWPGVGANLYNEKIGVGKTRLHFSEIAIFRNGAPVTSAGINFKLIKASENTYGGKLENSGRSNSSLGGYENGPVLKVKFPKDIAISKGTTVDICMVLKEPTLAIDFTAEIAGNDKNPEECLRSIAKSIMVNAALIGERVFADITKTESGEFELYVTKPYLVNGMLTIHFNIAKK